MHPEEYAGFLENADVTAFTESVLQIDNEIDHVGFAALARILLLPAKLGLEILSLNRYSASDELDSDLHMPEGAAQSVIRTLHRP